MKASDVYVITYRRILAEEALEPDIIARGALSTAADPEAGVDGDRVKAVLARTQNFQCDGTNASTDHCIRLHRQAEDRVITRLQDSGTGRVGVVWRDMHPLIAEGVALPGEPFRAVAKGIEVIVEAERLVESRDPNDTGDTGAVLTLAEFQELENHLDAQEARSAYRQEIRRQSVEFEAEREDFNHRLERHRNRLVPSSARRAETAAMFEHVRSEIDGIFQGAGVERFALLRTAEISSKSVDQMRDIHTSARERLSAVMAPIDALSSRLRNLESAKEVVTRLQAAPHAAAGEHTSALGRLRSTVERLVGEIPDAAIATARVKCEENLRAAFDGVDGILRAALVEAETALREEDADLPALAVIEQRVADLIARSVTLGVQGMLPLQELEDALDRGLCRGWASVTTIRNEVGDISHWDVRFENSGDTAWIGTVVLCNSLKNSGLGFESMAVPNRGSAAVQKIRADGEYGYEIPAPGTRIRLAIRGYASTELPLPEHGVVRIPVRNFAPMPVERRDDQHMERKHVLAKRCEKEGYRYGETSERKVLFFEHGQPWSSQT